MAGDDIPDLMREGVAMMRKLADAIEQLAAKREATSDAEARAVMDLRYCTIMVRRLGPAVERCQNFLDRRH